VSVDAPSSQVQLAERFLALHRPGAPLLMRNSWDAGSARLREHGTFGFAARAGPGARAAAAVFSTFTMPA